MKLFNVVIGPLFLLLFSWQVKGQEQSGYETPSEDKQQEIWHIKALHPDGYTLDVKALDVAGKRFDVKALEDANQSYIMDIKAFVGGDALPVKVLVSEEQYKPVAAIDAEGKLYGIVAIDKNGKQLEVRGVRKSGYIVHIKAVAEDGIFYGVKAISQKGKLKDVKGIKMYDKRLEMTLNGVEVHAHLAALPQIQ